MRRQLHSPKLCAALLALGALAAGCPDTLQQSCPPGTASVGGLQINFTAQDDAGDFCHVNSLSDGGPTDGAVTLPPASTQGSFCASPADAGLLYLAISGQVTRQGAVDPNGGFTFLTQATQVGGNQCTCEVDIYETFSGTLTAKGGGPATFSADGGFAQVGSMAATLVDSIAYSDAGQPADDAGHPPADAGCHCNLPCALRYTLTGNPL